MFIYDIEIVNCIPEKDKAMDDDDFLEWLIENNSHRKPLAFSLIFEREE